MATKRKTPKFKIDQVKSIPSPERYMDTNTLTQYLGISRIALWRKQDNGKFPLPCKIVGFRNYWRRKDVITWLKAGDHGYCKLSPQALTDMQGAA